MTKPTLERENPPSLWALAKLSVLPAAMSAARIFALMVVSGPLVAGIRWAFDRTSKLDWRLFLYILLFVPAVWFLGVFFSMIVELRDSEIRAESTNPVFRGTSLLRGIYALGACMWVATIFGLHREGDSWWMQIIPAGLLLLTWVAWPRAIYCSHESLRQRNSLGRFKRLPYDDVDYISYISPEEKTVVVGTNVEIVHSNQHVDRELFHSLLVERTGKPINGR